MGVQRQQECGAFLHDAHSSMPVPVDASLVPFGLPKPTLQIEVILEAWQRGRDTLDLLQVLTDDQVFRMHLGHASVDTGGQALEVGVCAAATVGIQVPLERSTDVSQGLRHA